MIWLFDGYNYLVKKINYNNKNLPFVSVVVAIKNEEHNLSTLINNLINQDYPEKLYEIIICNDRSDDNSLDIIQSLIYQFTVRLLSRCLNMLRQECLRLVVTRLEIETYLFS